MPGKRKESSPAFRGDFNAPLQEGQVGGKPGTTAKQCGQRCSMPMAFWNGALVPCTTPVRNLVRNLRSALGTYWNL